MKFGAILLCAGRGERLGLDLDKALAPLAGRALFTWSLETLERCAAIEGIVVVGAIQRLEPEVARAGLAPRKIVAWCEGGRERQDSVGKGLEALPAEFDGVAVHDCARALVGADLVRRVVADALAHGASIAAIPLEDTLKRVRLERVEATIPRAGMWRAQTPQAFRRDWLEAAHRAAAATATDDAALVESLGHPVHVAMGDPMNFKITTRADLEAAEARLLAGAARR